MMEIAETLARETDSRKQHTLGCYWCFEVGDWPTGLQHLAMASNQKFEKIAILDRAGSETLEQRKKIADAWFELFSEIKGDEKRGVAIRALHHHKAILDAYAGIDKTIIENRIKELEEQKLTEPGEEYLKH